MDAAAQASVNNQIHADDLAIAGAEARANLDRQSFDKAYATYQQLGGKVDYTRQLPR